MPFYQAGAKLFYEGSDKFQVEFWAINGYHNFLDNNDSKSFGILISYKYNKNTVLTYIILFGTESLKNAPVNKFRTYHNLYLNTQFGEKIFFILGGDLELKLNSRTQNISETAVMFNGLATLRYKFNKNWSITGRAEIFEDKSGFISGSFPGKNGELKVLNFLVSP